MISKFNHYKSKLDIVTRGLAAVIALGVVLAAPAHAQDAKTIAATVCSACHGEDGNSLVPMFPKIAGLQESYIVKQLRDFQSGRRKSDIMAPVVAALKPEDFLALGTYFAGQSMKAGVVEDKKQSDLGKLVFFDGNEDSGLPACVGCHQAQGAGHTIYPRIGGQHVTYVTQQLKNFSAGDRSNDVSRFMRVIAKRMTDEEIDAVAAYVATLGAK
jgi:cytochrome c553